MQLGQPGIQAMAEVATTIHGCGGLPCRCCRCYRPAGQFLRKPTRAQGNDAGPPRRLDQTVRLEAVQPELLRELVAARLEVDCRPRQPALAAVNPFTEAELDLSRWPQERTRRATPLLVFAEALF